MQFVVVSSHVVEDKLVHRSIASTPSSSLQPQVAHIQRKTGFICGPGKEVTSKEWLDKGLRHHEIRLCIHQIGE